MFNSNQSHQATMSNVVKRELKYFNMRGRAEALRLALVEAGIDFVDTSVEKENWPEMKPNAPFGQLPILIETTDKGEIQIPQTLAILRHIGRIGNLYGKTEEERTRIDYLIDEIEDWIDRFALAVYHPNYMKDVCESFFFLNMQKTLVDKYFAESFPIYAKFIELEIHDNGLLIGDTITVVDVFLFSFLKIHLDVESTSLDAFPRMKHLCDTVSASRKIAAYLPRQRPSEILLFKQHQHHM